MKNVPPAQAAPQLSVIIPTHNPRRASLTRVLVALHGQSLRRDVWELIVVDNASSAPLDLADYPACAARLVREEQLGLTYARLRGLAESLGQLLVWVDDDNVLAPDYLEHALGALHQDASLGAAGGKALPEYEQPPASWFSEGMAPLGCRDLGESAIYMAWNGSYPAAAPIGAGLVIRRDAMQAWAQRAMAGGARLQLGRRGTQLTSGEDNDICLSTLHMGLRLAYLPQLQLRHLIAAGRVQKDYLARISRASFRDFVAVLDLYGIRPLTSVPAWTVPLRAARAFVRLRAWAGPANYVQWQAAVGQFEGRARLRGGQ